jgi:bud site selection protein 20
MGKFKPQKVSKRHVIARRKKDLDQIYDEINNPKPNMKKAKKKFDPDLPGFGKFFCQACDRYFISQKAEEAHLQEKTHKRRVKKLQQKPYGDFESQGIKIDNGKPLRRQADNAMN